MFVAPASLMLEHLKKNQPELFTGISHIAQAWDTAEREEVMNAVWPTLPKIAIDYAVAEPAAAAGDVAMVPGSFSWDDVGDFDAVARLCQEKSGEDTTVLGNNTNVLIQDSSGIIASETTRCISVIGIENVVVIDTEDALLVTDRRHAQKVKDTVAELKSRQLDELL